MTQSANEIAQNHERRERFARPDVVGKPTIRGTLSVWVDVNSMTIGRNPLCQSVDVTIDLSKPGVIVAYDRNGDAEIFYPAPGWYVNFVPDREGE